MSKVTVYCFKKYSILKDEEILAPRMATLEAIKQFQCIPLMDTGKEVDSSELTGNGEYPKIFTVVYATQGFPAIDHNTVGKMITRKYSSLEGAKATGFPIEDRYIFASMEVCGGFWIKKLNEQEWKFINKNDLKNFD
ncbi:MAG: hypothetical protein ABSF20_00595 [Smithella sp.]